MEEWVERMVVVHRIVEVPHIAEEVVLRIQEPGIRIVAVGEVAHNLAVAEDMLVDHIGLPAALENRMIVALLRRGVAEEDMLAGRTVLGAVHHKLAVEEDILEEGIDLEAVDHKPVVQEEVGHMVVEGEDTVHRAVEGNLFTISTCHHLHRVYSRP
jgi:RNA-splicing ligase RtcB